MSMEPSACRANPAYGALHRELPSLGLGACANLTAVRNFARLGSDVIASTTAIDSYPTAASAAAVLAAAAEIASGGMLAGIPEIVTISDQITTAIAAGGTGSAQA